MKRLGELDNIQLLYEVKADALQPIDKPIDDAGGGCQVDFAKTAWMRMNVERLLKMQD